MTGDRTEYRLDQLERAVETMATAAAEQQQFNTTVERFMERVTTWGKAGLIVYGSTQGVALVLLAYSVSHVRFVA